MNEPLVISRNTILISEKHKNRIYKIPEIQVPRPSKTYIFLDQALLYVGDNSVYSKRILLFICVYWIWYTFLFMGMPLLIEGEPILFCPVEGQDGYEVCDEERACANFKLEELMIQPEKSIVEEFKLICHRKRFIPWINMVIFLSVFISGPFYSYISNKFGRKQGIFLSCLVSSVCLFFAGIVTDFYLWMILIFFAGGGFSGLEVVGRVYLSEISGSNFRINSMAFLNLVWACSQVFLVIIKVVFNYWRNIFIYFMGISFFVMMLIGHFFFMLESPKFLLHNNMITVE